MMHYSYSTTFNAPIKYVFDWCTDYSSDDYKLSGGKYPRIVLEKTRRRAVFASYKQGRDGNPKLAVRIVSLYPSKYSWHLDYFGEEDLETGEYKLTQVGKNKTRLDMSFNHKWKLGQGPSREEFRKHLKDVWGKYGAALEREYASEN